MRQMNFTTSYRAVDRTHARMKALARREGRKLGVIVNEACLAYLAEKSRELRPSACQLGRPAASFTRPSTLEDAPSRRAKELPHDKRAH